MAVRIENFANTRARSNHKAVKCVNAEGRKCKYIAKFTCLPVRELASVPGWPPPSIRWAHIPTVCACALPLLTDRSNWQSRWRLQPCDPQTGLRTDTTQATDQRVTYYLAAISQPCDSFVSVNDHKITSLMSTWVLGNSKRLFFHNWLFKGAIRNIFINGNPAATHSHYFRHYEKARTQTNSPDHSHTEWITLEGPLVHPRKLTKIYTTSHTRVC